MRRRTLLRRIVILVVAIELMCAACFCFLALAHEWQSRLRAVDSTLQGRSDSLLGAVQDQENPADDVFVDPRELRLPEGDFYAVYNRNGALLGGKERASVALTQRAGNGFRTMRSHGQPYRVLEREALRIIDREESGGVGLQRPVTIVYATPTSRLLHETVEAAGFYVVASLLLAGTTALLLVVSVRKLLSPLRELADAANAITASALVFHPPPNALQTGELRPLALGLSDVVTRLKEAFEKQHRFVGDAAHELKTAVAVVRSSVQVLALRGRSQDEYRAGLEQVLTDTERVEELIARMLLLARLEESPGRRDESTHLAAAVRDSLASIASYAAARQIRIESRLLERDTLVCLSSEALATLTSNLVVNAVQHSCSGSVVSVIVRRSEKPSPAAVLEVADQGEGIAAKDVPYLCDRFYRTDLSRSRQTGGAGLGLAICKTIVESASGHIEFQSVEGEGTTVTVYLPLAPSPSPASSP